MMQSSETKNSIPNDTKNSKNFDELFTRSYNSIPTKKNARTFTASDPEEGFFDTTLLSSLDDYGEVTKKMAYGDSRNDKVEKDDGTSDSSNDKDNKGESRKRSSVREHSKAQREKRKAAVDSMETEARKLTHELNERTKMIKQNMDQYKMRRKWFFDTLSGFLSLWIGGDCSNDTESWEQLVSSEMTLTLPVTCIRYAASYGKPMLKDRRVLRGLRQVKDDSVSFYILKTAIAKLGHAPICNFLLGVMVHSDTFTINNDTSMGKFSIVSKNAVLCGGNFDINVEGILIICHIISYYVLNISCIYFGTFLCIV